MWLRGYWSGLLDCDEVCRFVAERVVPSGGSVPPPAEDRENRWVLAGYVRGSSRVELCQRTTRGYCEALLDVIQRGIVAGWQVLDIREATLDESGGKVVLDGYSVGCYGDG